MTDKSLLRRIERIKGILDPEPKNIELTPGLRDMVDMVLARGRVAQERLEDEHDRSAR